MALKQLPEDFKEFLNFLNENRVKYLLLGGWAVGIYGYPRATADMDILIATDDDNLEKLQKALFQFGAPTVDNDLFKEDGNVFRMGRSPIRIEILNSVSGLEFKDAYNNRKMIDIEGIEISVISKNDLIKNKRASGRAKDLADIEWLENIKE